MPVETGVYGMLVTFINTIVEICLYWQKKLFSRLTSRSPVARLQQNLADAKVFEQWEAAAYQLDELQGHDLWRQNSASKYYDYRLIYERLQYILQASEAEDTLSLVNLLRSGLVRNLGNITAPRLFNRAYGGTKLLIEEYISQVALAVEQLAANPTSGESEFGLTSQAKLDFLHDTRQAFGRTALVLEGGAIFGLCHLGVVKALHLRGLLPRIIAGTATGALIAALVGVHTEDELLGFLQGERIDLSAFTFQSGDVDSNKGTKDTRWTATLFRRVRRFLNEGYFLDAKVLEECVRANVGDLTFEEAYNRTRRVLNITVTTDRTGGVPGLLNYITAPNVLIWSAAVASQASSPPLYAPVTLFCKDDAGQIHPWLSSTFPSSSGKLQSVSQQVPSNSAQDFDAPLSRIAELFNVNHFVVSQARPYIAPFLQSGGMLAQALPTYSTTRRKGRIWLPFLRICVLEIQHRLRQLDSLGLLHPRIRRFLVDDMVPGASITLVPELSTADFFKLLETPTRTSVDEWILRGERSVWPAIGALRVRCAVEIELDRGYQFIRRRKPMDTIGKPKSGTDITAPQEDMSSLKSGGQKRRKRNRASSYGGSRRTGDDKA